MQLVAAFCVPLWSRMTRRLGKRAVFRLGLVVLLAVVAAILAMPPQLTPPALYVIAIAASGAGLSVAFLLPWRCTS